MSELIDPHHARQDLRTLEMAIRKGFKIPDAIFENAAAIMGQILAKGNNREKVAAARVIVAMNAQNNPPQPPPQPIVNVGVKIENNNSDSGRNLASQIVERIRASRVSGDDT